MLALIKLCSFIYIIIDQLLSGERGRGMDGVMKGWQERRDRQTERESETDRNEWTDINKN